MTSNLDDLRPGKRELRVTLKDAAGPMGITAATVADQLRAAYLGTTISEMQIAGSLVEVTAQFGMQERGSHDVFDNFNITRADGSYVPLSVVAQVEIGQGYSRINREDGVRSVTVQGSIDTRTANANAIVSDTMTRFAPRLVGAPPQRNP